MTERWSYIGKIKELARLWGGRCVVCGSKAGLEFAHVRKTGISGRGRGLPRRYHDIKKHPECFVLMCHWCHYEFDLGLTAGKEKWR